MDELVRLFEFAILSMVRKIVRFWAQYSERTSHGFPTTDYLRKYRTVLTGQRSTNAQGGLASVLPPLMDLRFLPRRMANRRGLAFLQPLHLLLQGRSLRVQQDHTQRVTES